ncbi:TolC family protein [Melioribacter sp. Ez-97]|uniref:TolC family protein n=1 Tax=Melioribacter sp. Ez-97 TaxID=3423434 RepID=UPI003EDB03F8
MKKIWMLIVVSAGLVFGQTNERLVLDIDTAIKLALENNPNVKIARMEVNKSEEKFRETVSGYYPKIDASAQYQRYINKPVIFLPPGSPFGTTLEIGSDNSYNAAVSLSLPIFSLSLIEGTKTASLGVDMAKVNLRNTEIKTVTNVKKSFLGVLLAREYKTVMQQSLKNAQDNLENIKKLNAQGLMSDYDLLRAEVQVENLKPAVLQAENNYKLTLDGLKVTIGLDASKNIDVKGELKYDENFVVPEYDETLSEVLKNNPQIELLDKQVEISQKSVSLQKAAYYPSLAAFSNYQYQTQSNDFKFQDYKWVKTFLVGVQVQLPIFNGFKTNALVEQAEISLNQAVEQKEGFLKAVKTQISSVIYNISQAVKRIEAQSKTVEQAQKGYEIAKTRLENGLSTQLEVNDAELALRQAKLNRLQAVYDFHSALADLHELTGKSFNYEIKEN